MNKLDDIKNTFSKKLDRRIADHATRLEDELAILRKRLLESGQWSAGGDWQPALDSAKGPAVKGPARDLLIDLRRAAPLEAIDRYFSDVFELQRYFPRNRLDYPTVYCETPEEFFAPILADENISPQMRAVEMRLLIEQAEQTARETKGGGILGYNLPGKGCYLNGWLLAYGSGQPPSAALEDPQRRQMILATAAHEKLGHGFLSAYSALGAVKTRLGMEQAAIAEQFGLRAADDVLSSKRLHQHNLLHFASQLLEEGWATWIETFITAEALGAGERPRYSLPRLFKAVKSLSAGKYPQEREALQNALKALFSPEPMSPETLHQAVLLINSIAPHFDEHFSKKLGQPLIYVVGELLASQAEENLGTQCVPYAALIAANVTVDFDDIGLTDLLQLLQVDSRLHPDARFAALSRMPLEQKNDVSVLAQRAEALLNFSVPQELKGRR